MFEHKVFNGAHRRMHAWIWIIGLLSIAIVLQVLGTPISFGKTIGTSDLVEAADLEGFSVSSKGVDLFPILQTLFTLHAQELQYRFSFEYAVFRPPTFSRWVISLQPSANYEIRLPEMGSVISYNEDRSMKTLLCNLGVLTLLIAPFIIIPAAVIGYGLFICGIEELALWICGGASAASLILGPVTFRTFCKWERQSPGSLRRDDSAKYGARVGFGYERIGRRGQAFTRNTEA